MKNTTTKNLSEKYVTALEQCHAMRDEIAALQAENARLQAEISAARAENIRLQARMWAVKTVSLILTISVFVWKLA